MDNLNMVLLSGGYYRCTPDWNAEPKGADSCYKLYFPIEGDAEVCIDETWYRLDAGNAYYINGYKLDKHRCNDYMDVYWLHFVPESHLVSMHINKLEPFFCWKGFRPEVSSADFMQIPRLFEDPDKKENRLVNHIDFSSICKVNSLILKFISQMTDSQQVNFYSHEFDLFDKLKAAVDFIDSNFTKGLMLEEMAQKVYLNPSYFLRLFKKCFKMTPNEYITAKRLNEACRLLARTNLTIREISESLGYCNQFYFSKIFSRYFQRTPLQYRNKKQSP